MFDPFTSRIPVAAVIKLALLRSGVGMSDVHFLVVVVAYYVDTNEYGPRLTILVVKRCNEQGNKTRMSNHQKSAT
jgi:hypothetical protein